MTQQEGGQYQTVGTSKSRQTNHNAAIPLHFFIFMTRVIHAFYRLAVTLWWTFAGSAVEGYTEVIKRGSIG
jgi:hypothetical protein